MYKFILKNAQKLKNYIEEKTLLTLNDIYLENNFKFHYSQYLDGKDRLINIYTRFKENEKIIKILIHNLKETNKKEQAELIDNNLYKKMNLKIIIPPMIIINILNYPMVSTYTIFQAKMKIVSRNH